MVGMHLFATPNAAAASAWNGEGRLGVALFHNGSPELAGLGNSLVESVERDLPSAPSQASWDFLSIALAVFAGDRFVLRGKGEDGWTRIIHLRVAVAEPDRWKPLEAKLASTFRFLTGDVWSVEVTGGGSIVPEVSPRMSDRNEICLFSGGLDSLLGALKLQELDRSPLLVSQGSPKEIGPQVTLAHDLGLASYRFEGRVNERWKAPYEPSTRGRSILFFAYGALAASACGLTVVHVPENGLIAINAPLTRRRVGSLSTRTTHPHFLSGLNSIFAESGMQVELRNMFETQTKGEMLRECTHDDKEALAAKSYSCGKGKRLNKQCGRCVPCLIRRASIKEAGLEDLTVYHCKDIGLVPGHDDVLAARIGAARVLKLSDDAFERWVRQAGPLPADHYRKNDLVQCVKRGITEISSYLDDVEWR